MIPSYQNHGKVHVISRGLPQRFDAVVIDFGEEGYYLKRVIGLPGETIIYKDHQLYVNDQKIADPYGKLTADFDLQKVFKIAVIPEGQYFVLGDNRKISKDSRYFGLVSVDQLKGIVSEEDEE